MTRDLNLGDRVQHLRVTTIGGTEGVIGLVTGYADDGSRYLVRFPEPHRVLTCERSDLRLVERLHPDADDIRAGRHPGTLHLLDLFEYRHLPPHLAVISAKFEVLACDLVIRLSDGPELSAGLRKLVEAKDCAVRQAVIDHRQATPDE